MSINHYKPDTPWYQNWNNFFPADAYSIEKGKEKISEFFILTVGAASQVLGSTKSMDGAKNDARRMRDELGMENVRVRRITRIGSIVERG